MLNRFTAIGECYSWCYCVSAVRGCCAEIGYTEARAALAAAHRNARLTKRSHTSAKAELEGLWAQVEVVVVGTALIRAAGDLAEDEKLRGYDAVHLAAGLASGAAVFASADDRLLAAARRHGLATSNPLSRPVALLGPLPQGSPLERLRASGEVEPATGDLDDLPAPLPSRGAERPSSRLARLREHER